MKILNWDILACNLDHNNTVKIVLEVHSILHVKLFFVIAKSERRVSQITSVKREVFACTQFSNN